MLRFIKKILPNFIKKTMKFMFYYPCYVLKFIINHEILSDSRFICRWRDRYPCLYDATDSTVFDAHYIHHPAWAARILSRNRPERHIDISSSLSFISIVSAFIPVEFYDYRPASLGLTGLKCLKNDLTSLSFENNSIVSLSCMHVVEHIGLGRYGDPIDPQGDIKAMKELERVLSIGGILIFVVPVGKPKIQFNAHRIYSYKQIIDRFSRLDLLEFSLITDQGDFVENATDVLADQQKYGCGCFLFRKYEQNTENLGQR